MRILPLTNNSNNNFKKNVFCAKQFEQKNPMPAPYSLNKTDFLLPWVKDTNLSSAISQLNHLRFDPEDVGNIQAMGVILPFLSGEDAVRYIKDFHVGVKFSRMPSQYTHAQYDFDENCIKINEIYQFTQNPAEILAISEAILHEAGHAKDRDGASTIQEELGCLALNALSHRVFVKNHPQLFKNSNSLIIKDGVCVYADLFFDPDPQKTKLTERMRRKYGELPAGDMTHPPSALALKIKGF